MNEYNVWESITFQTITIDELIQNIKSGKTNLTIGRRFIPGDKTNNYLEVLCDEKNKCVNYTDKDHPITSSDICGLHISTEYFKKYEKEIKDAFIEAYNNPELDIFTIPNFMFSQELLDMLLTKKDIVLNIKDVKLTSEQISQIQEHFIDATLDNKQISRRYVIGYIPYTDVLTKTNFHLDYDVITKCDYNNFVYFKENSIFETYNYITKDYKKDLIEEIYFKFTFKLLENVDKLGKKFYFKINVSNRSVLEKYLKEHNFKNIELRIYSDLYEYSYQEYINEEKKLNDLVAPIKNSNLSPFEKYIAVYNLVKNFKPYKENNDNREQARYLRYILDNDYIVCVGYTTLLQTLLDKVGVKSNCISVTVDTSYDSGFDEKNPEEISVTHGGHQRLVVDMEDDKYNIHGLYMADATWDNNLEKDYLNHALMTFDNMITNKRMFYFSTYEPILCFHTFKDYSDQVNYLIKEEMKEEEKNFLNHGIFEKTLNNSFKNVASTLLNSIRCDIRIKYFNDLLDNCKSQKDYENFFTELGQYLLLRINKPLEKETIMEANDVVQLKINNKEINTAREDYDEKDLRSFPYEVPLENDHNLSIR